MVRGHGGPLAPRAFVKAEAPMGGVGGGAMAGVAFDARWFLFQDDAKRKAMLLAFEKHNRLMAEAQEGQGGPSSFTAASC